MLINKLKEDRIKHFKMRNDNPVSRVAYSVLGVLIGDATKESKEPTDEKVIAMIKKFVENSKVCLENAKDELTKFSSEKEIEVLNSYLPKQLSEDEIRLIITSVINKTGGNANIGMIMKLFKENHSGCYDGALVSKITKEMI